MNPPIHQFTSDNRSRICPEAWAALAAANTRLMCSWATIDADIDQFIADLQREREKLR